MNLMISKLILGIGLTASLLSNAQAASGGLSFSCTPDQKAVFEPAMAQYLKDLEIKSEWVVQQTTDGHLLYSLAEPIARTSAVSLAQNPELDIKEEVLMLPTIKKGKQRGILTVSRKEIVMALLHPGRRTEASCDIQALKDHVGIRQNTVAWAERLEWRWPDGGPAEWNKKFWKKGTPITNPVAAFNDAFLQQKKYAIGCYTATKLVVAQGVLDYYARVRPDAILLKKVVERLNRDNDPLIDIEPPAMWSFEKDFNPADAARSGKLLYLAHSATPENFVPGDWAYLRNTDDATNEKTGYEGSNAIYLGRGKFDDYYNDHNYSYAYLEKLDEVYQWRNEVFSRSRDMDKVKPLTVRQVRNLGLTPAEGGLVMPYRAVPYFFDQPNLP